MGWNTLAGLAVRDTTSALGQDVIFTPSGGAAEAVTAIWYDSAEDVQILDGVPVISPALFVVFRLADLSQAPAAGDGVTVDGTSYTISEVRADGLGASKCRVLK